MRIADKMAFSQVNHNVSKNRSEMNHLQNQAATQKRVTKPSDDPLAAFRVLGARTEEKGATQFLKNLNIAKAFLEFSDQSLGELTDALVRAKELAINQSSDGSSTPESKRAVAAEVDQIYNQSVQIGNRKLGDRFVFGGHRTLTAPFDLSGNYHGDDGDIKIQVNKEAFLAMNLPGNKIFHGKGLDLDGHSRSRVGTPVTADDLKEWQENEKIRLEQESQKQFEPTKGVYRGLASIQNDPQEDDFALTTLDTTGKNVFEVLKNLEIGLSTDSKDVIQNSLDELDEAIAQVVLARAQIGARIMALDSNMETLQKVKVDTKVMASELEDADVFQLMSDINRTEGTLKATLETSGRMVQPSLLDFLK